MFSGLPALKRTLSASYHEPVSAYCVDSLWIPALKSILVRVDFALGNNFLVTIGGNRTLAAPTNAVAGQTGNIYVIQDGTGSRTLSYNTAYQFVSAAVPTLSTGAGDVDMLIYSARSTATIDSVLLKNFDR